MEMVDKGHVLVYYLTIESSAVVSCCNVVCDTAEDVHPSTVVVVCRQ